MFEWCVSRVLFLAVASNAKRHFLWGLGIDEEHVAKSDQIQEEDIMRNKEGGVNKTG